MCSTRMAVFAIMSVGSLAFAVRFSLSCAIGGLLLIQCFSHVVKPLLIYGKTASTQARPLKTSIGSAVVAWQVPRGWFKHFYFLSTCLALVMLVLSLQRDVASAAINSLLMLSHSARRLYECFYVERPSGSKMWIGHYFAGLFFYIMANLAMVVEIPTKPPSQGSMWCCLLCFALCQGIQHRVHKRLAQIRGACKQGEYANPTDGSFRYFVAPHYTAEVLLYTCIAILNYDNLCLWLVVLWTISILGISAQQTQLWGAKKCGDWGKRWTILPGI